MPIKWINQSRRTGLGPPDATTNVIGWPSADILKYVLAHEYLYKIMFKKNYVKKGKQII